ncbi:hypothetical protein A9Q84_09900 [Halobacteriovorax marinus]|uniref:RDD domain-containing protein n=1 Tax=Halobacteriovorax marinus TaxID=97084 RepID=A0A1Y5F6Y4_9BACT|nr:hypothetical protein A9Q84_09900 [Halobacteriovorax marinus]
MSDSKDDDNWEFELSEETAPAKKKKKKTKKKVTPLLNTQKAEKILNLDDSSRIEKKSRRQMAREVGEATIKARDIVEPAAHWKRLLASLVDGVVIGGIFGVSQVIGGLIPEIGSSIEEFLGPEIIGSIPLNVGGVAVALVLHFLIMVVPVASTQRSIGKKLFKLKILGTMKPKAPLGVIIIREYIAKPLAIISVIGLMMILLNKNRRGLHDYISGTMVLDM